MTQKRGNSNTVKITGELARKWATQAELPSKEPTFELEVTEAGVYLGYDAGLDYDKDGHTFEKEWRLWPVVIEKEKEKK